jgi:HD-GYP domain-containing protein (c-di-GMP phosphodiesterase class II)
MASNTNANHGGTAAPRASLGRDRRGVPLHIHIVTLFLLLIISVGGVIAWHNYVEDRKLVVSASQELIKEIGGKSVAALAAISQPVELVIDLLARQRLGQATSLEERMTNVPMLADALEHTPALSALYVGYSSGDFFLLRPFRDDGTVRGQFKAPADAVYLVQSIERDRGDAMHGAYLFLDKDLRVVERREAPYYAFDPRVRIWYEEATATKRRVRTPPYVFFTTGDVGVTYARQSDVAAGAVLGADLTLRDVSQVLRQQRLTPSSELLLFTSDGTALAYDKPERMKIEAVDRSSARLAKVSELGSPVLTRITEQLNPAVPLSRFALEVGGRTWDGTVSRLLVEGEPRGVYLAALSPEDELFGEARRISRDTLLIALGIMVASIPVAWLLSRLLATPLRSLQHEARSVREFDFASGSPTRSIVTEVDELAQSMEAMRVTIRNFLDIAATISAERNFQRLLDRILGETIDAAGSAAGAVYLFDEGNRTLRSAAVKAVSGASSSLTPVEITATLAEHPVWRAAAEAKTLVAPLDAKRSDLARLIEPAGGVASASNHTVIAVPLSNREREILGVVCLLNDTGASALPRHLVSFVEALSGTAAIAIDNQMLLQEQKHLLDSLIKLVAGAIDAKSPYTGGHCQRVPEIATMLARAACDATQGPFRDFDMTDDEWETLHVAAWLHDCGKVTTPEYVVDKATKLQTIYDRLHEVRMRFEVLKRDAEIDCWRRVADGGDRVSLQAELDAKRSELDDEFRFIAECNEGGESMPAEAIERIKRIARRTWLRTLDDRVGLSQEERKRAGKVPAPPLPVVERLLADKPEQIVEWSEAELRAATNARQFRLRMPPHKRNGGEIYNLCIGRGTLNDEERFTINDHVVQTIKMLSQLPFPRHLKSVPEISGGHHEKLDGTGYPRRLAGQELSLPARILAIADIFEALTARDRPYKTGRTLSEAVAVMASMSKARHIDADLFELFLTSRVHLQYAARFLEPAQIDEVDVEEYVTLR